MSSVHSGLTELAFVECAIDGVFKMQLNKAHIQYRGMGPGKE